MRSSDSLGFRANLKKAEFAGRLARKNRAKKALTEGYKSLIIGMRLPVSALEKENRAPGLQPIYTPHGDGNSSAMTRAAIPRPGCNRSIPLTGMETKPRNAKGPSIVEVATDLYPSRGWKHPMDHGAGDGFHAYFLLQPIYTPHGDGNR